MARLFHTLVVYGASAALTGCGTASDGSPPPGDGMDEGGAGPGGVAPVDLGGAGGGGGAASSGGATTQGGTGGSSIGGAFATDGGAFVVEAGAGGSAGAFVPDQGPSAYSQWSCITDAAAGCDALWLTAPCEVDPTRPRTPQDCGAGEWFECYRATFDGAEILVHCSCVPMGNVAGCSRCDGLVAEGFMSTSCSGTVSVCECYTGILR